ncbi:MAG: hypothetical protein VYB05_08345 [Pseudomonadota bacterium]|nr:hypothetical protein [Pseudomonadota bacterium]
MYAHSLIVGTLVATGAGAAEPAIFHTSRFPDATTVNLSLLTHQRSTSADYDVDVTIGLTELSDDGAPGYRDRSMHRARVRCAMPASVFVGRTGYAVLPSTSSHDTGDWKRDLWRAVCAVPTS